MSAGEFCGKSDFADGGHRGAETGSPLCAAPGVPLGLPRLLTGSCLQVFNYQPFPIIRKDIKSGWLIAKVMLALPDRRGRGPFSFQVVSLAFFFLDQL